MRSKKRILSSRTIALSVLVFAGIVIGFGLAVFYFSGGNIISGTDPVYAQDRSGVDIQGQPSGNSLGAQGFPGSAPLSFRDVAEAVLPTVVQLNVTESVAQGDRQGDVPWFYYFFQQPPGEQGEPRQQPRTPAQGLGSGVIVQRNGTTYYVLTNAHVAGGASEIEVSTYSRESYAGKLVGSDTRRDLALVSFVSNEDLPVARLGDSDSLHVGDWVLAVGNPFGFSSTVTAGIISALGRQGGPDGNINDFIQTDASINQGNSGGALVNLDNEVIGINTWIATPSGVSIGLGFAIPINNAKRAISDFIASGSVEYGWLGVSISDVPQEITGEFKVARNTGAFIHHIFRDSPAEKGGLQPGDIVLEMNKIKITSRDQLTRLIGDLRAGDSAGFRINRLGVERSLTIRIARRESQQTILQMQRRLWPGLTVLPLSDAFRTQFQIDKNVKGVFVIDVESRTTADTAGFRPGDVILSVNNRNVPTVLEFYRQLNSASSDKLQFRFLRDGAEISAGIENSR